MLDKKRLRQIFLGIFGVFSTLVPLMFAFNTDGADAIHYASFNDRPEIYAFNPDTRSYPESVGFCSNHWMRPAVFRSAEELAAMHLLTHGRQAFIGASRAAFNKGETPTDFEWDTRTSCVGSSCTGTEASMWLPQDIDHIIDFDSVGSNWLFVETDADGPDGIRYDATDNTKGILCMASSVAAIKGVLPPIRNLGDSPVVVRSLANCSTQKHSS